MNKPIFNYTPFTMLDFPGKLAAIIWFTGCNMRCGYCYNPEIVLGKGQMNYSSILKFLKTRKNLLDGVVLSGGECTLHRGLFEFCQDLKNLGFAIKLDTNGTRPDVIAKLLDEKLLDYVALDFKAPEEKFFSITGFSKFSAFEKSIELLVSSCLSFEVRTTFHDQIMDKNHLQQMLLWLRKKRYSGTFFVQQAVANIPTLGNLKNSSILVDFEDDRDFQLR
ncbi:MAG: anaerobic ribonucleoside-triphosphate reductase activating protein [Cryomorphaceae bacterium]|nr:anaerobic ribonucleoside-triphosphate reductase activating protein [Cryomorphaceae bacterium]